MLLLVYRCRCIYLIFLYILSNKKYMLCSIFKKNHVILHNCLCVCLLFCRTVGFLFITHHTIVAGYVFSWTSVCPSVFRLITRVNFNGLSPNFVCTLILWRSGLGLLMGKFPQFLPTTCLYFCFRVITCVNVNGFS